MSRDIDMGRQATCGTSKGHKSSDDQHGQCDRNKQLAKLSRGVLGGSRGGANLSVTGVRGLGGERFSDRHRLGEG